MTEPDAASLRERLLACRAHALAQLAASELLDGGFLALIAGINAALAALDDEVFRDVTAKQLISNQVLNGDLHGVIVDLIASATAGLPIGRES